MREPDCEANHSNVLVVPRTTSSGSSRQGDRSATIRDQSSVSTFFYYHHGVGITFITTLSPFSAKIRGANSEPRYASRLYRALVANSAIAGVLP